MQSADGAVNVSKAGGPDPDEGAPGPSPLGTGDRLFPVSLQELTSELVKFFFAAKCPHLAHSNANKKYPKECRSFRRNRYTGFQSRKMGLGYLAGPEPTKLRAARILAGMHHTAIQVCSQNGAKSGRIAPNSLQFTTLARQIHNHPGIKTLLKNMMFWD